MLPSIRKGLRLEALTGSRASGGALRHLGAVSEPPALASAACIGGTFCLCGRQAGQDIAQEPDPGSESLPATYCV